MGWGGGGVVGPPEDGLPPGHCASGWRCKIWDENGDCFAWTCDQEEKGPILPIPPPTNPPPPPSNGGDITTVPSISPIAGFTYKVLENGYVQFTNTTLNTYQGCYWTFGNGKNSTLANPLVRYSLAGDYTVSLQAWNGSNTDTDTQTVTVTIEISKVDFSYLKSGLNVSFVNTSTITGPVIWSFGDQNFSSEDPQAFNAYAVAGAYTVTLWVGSRYKTKTIIVTESGEVSCNAFETQISVPIGGHDARCAYALGNYFYFSNTPVEGDFHKIKKYNADVSSLAFEFETDIEGTGISGIAVTSNRYYAAWHGTRGGSSIIEIRMYGATGTLLDNFGKTETEDLWNITSAAQPAIRFDVDETGNRIFVVIVETFGGGAEQYWEHRLFSLDLDGNTFEGCINGLLIETIINPEVLNIIPEIHYSNGKVYIWDSSTGTLKILDASNGSLLDQYELGEGILHNYIGFAIHGDRIFIGLYPEVEELTFYIRIYDLSLNLITCFAPYPDAFSGELWANDVYLYNFPGGSPVEAYPVDYNEPMAGASVGEPIALFTADVYSGVAPLTITVTDESYEATSYLYEWGDGNTSTFASGSHTFDNAGKYTVRQTITNALGSDSYEKTIIVYDQLTLSAPDLPDGGDIFYYIQVGTSFFAIDSVNHRVLIYNSLWELQGYFGGTYLSDPTQLVAFGDCILVVDRGNSNIQIFDINGVWQSTFGEYGTGNGQFNAPFGIGTNGVYIYVADTGNNRIQFFSFNEATCSILAYVGQIALDYAPYGIAFDDHFMYVIDKARCLLKVYTFEVEFIRAYSITCGYEFVKVEDGYVTTWGEDPVDGSIIWPTNPDFHNPEYDTEDSLTLLNNIYGIDLKKLLLTMNIVNPSGEAILLPLQLTMNVMQYLQPLILTMNVMPDVFTEYKKIPQGPTIE